MDKKIPIPWVAGALVLFGIVVWAFVHLPSPALTSVNTPAGSANYPEKSASVYEKMAVIESKSSRGLEDKPLISGMESRLKTLARKFPEDEERIAAMTVKAQELLEAKGVKKSLTEIMDAIDYSVPGGNQLGVRFAEAAAAYLTLDKSVIKSDYTRSAIGNDLVIHEAPLPEAKRRRVFYELVAAQDAGVGDAEAYTIIARKHGLPENMLYQIAGEGAAKGWPMP